VRSHISSIHVYPHFPGLWYCLVHFQARCPRGSRLSQVCISLHQRTQNTPRLLFPLENRGTIRSHLVAETQYAIVDGNDAIVIAGGLEFAVGRTQEFAHQHVDEDETRGSQNVANDCKPSQFRSVFVWASGTRRIQCRPVMLCERDRTGIHVEEEREFGGMFGGISEV
jgi:hypothetical protein